MGQSAEQLHEVSESFEFKAEVQQLLNILVHSLYTNREIFLRELISNASDALHRLQFEMLTNRDIVDPDAELAIRIDFDTEAGTLTVSDTGIGMTREELIENLGTIAHSGAMEFVKQLQEGDQSAAEIIGQFGVGFYSVFMVADEVTVTTRSFRPEAQAVMWTSRGENQYTIRLADKTSRGTVVELKLKEDAREFLDAFRIEQIVRRYSDFVPFPIYVRGKEANRRSAPWRQRPQDLTEEQYKEFYRQLTLDTADPLLYVHFSADAPVHIQSILYVPSKAERGLLTARSEHGPRLYSRKILIQERASDLLPAYLRFVEGVVDSDDIPLNISRETVQANQVMARIRSNLVRKLLSELKRLADEEPERYIQFWQEFGPFIKEGVAIDAAHHEMLVPLLRFRSSKTGGNEWISLARYKERMKKGQKAIYYVLGEDMNSIARSPHMDYFRAHDIEVLYLTEPIDSFLMMALQEYDGVPLRNIADASLDLPEVKKEETEEAETLSAEAFERLRKRFAEVLGERVVEVRESKILRDSPCRLVTPENTPGAGLQRVFRMLERDYEVPRMIMELNKAHPLIRDLGRLAMEAPDDPLIAQCAEQLYEGQLLAEGLHPDPADMVPRIEALMAAAAHARVNEASRTNDEGRGTGGES
ncbi:MAG TPA: molecular chaperone HtpG [Caldilineae bacterium]|nr:molecular chaperone HtpG [Caldilineae bacterium]